MKDKIKKYHLLAYGILMASILMVAYIVKWHHYDALAATYGPDIQYFYGYYNAMVAVILIGVTVVFVLYLKKVTLEKLFLGILIPLGVIFLLVVTPNGSADEDKHMYKVNNFANILTGIGETGHENTYFLRASDANSGLGRLLSVENYIQTSKEFFSMSQDQSMVEVVNTEPFSYNYATILFYFPGVMGLLLARLFALGPVLTILLCRIMLFAFYATACYFALKKIHTGKLLFALIMLMPMSIQRAASVSQDAVIHGGIFLFTAYAIYYIFHEEVFTRKDTLVMLLSGIILVVSKGGAYIPLLLLLFLIPRGNFGTKWKYPVIVGLAMGATVLVYLITNPSILFDMSQSSSSGDNIISWAKEPGYTMQTILFHPKHSMTVLLQTFFQNKGIYLQQMVTGGVGWLQLYLSDIWVLIYVILLLVSAMNMEGKEDSFPNSQKIAIAGFLGMSVLLIMLSMWLFWTPISAQTIMGVQGRYFIPLLFPALYLLNNRYLIVTRNSWKTLMAVAFAVNICCFFNIWLQIGV